MNTIEVIAVIWIPIVSFLGFVGDMARRFRKRARIRKSDKVVKMEDADYITPFETILWTYEVQLVHDACSKCVVCGRHFDIPLLTISHEMDTHTMPPWWRKAILFDEPKTLAELVQYCQERA